MVRKFFRRLFRLWKVVWWFVVSSYRVHRDQKGRSGWDAVDPLRQPAADDWNQSGWGKPSWEQSGWDQPGWDPPQPSPAPSNWQQQDSGWPTWQSDWDQPAGREERSTPAGTEHPRPQPVREQPPRRQAPAEPPMDDNMRALCAAVEGMQTTARVTGVDEKQLQALVHRVMIKPEYFWLDSRYSYRIPIFAGSWSR